MESKEVYEKILLIDIATIFPLNNIIEVHCSTTKNIYIEKMRSLAFFTNTIATEAILHIPSIAIVLDIF